MNFIFTHLGGPYGDETSDYQVHVDKEGCTVEDFIFNCIKPEVNHNAGWYGSIYVNSLHVADYCNQTITFASEAFETTAYETCKSWKPKDIKGKGGWGLMNYHLYCY